MIRYIRLHSCCPHKVTNLLCSPAALPHIFFTPLSGYILPAPPLRLSAATGPYQTRNFSVQRYLWLGKLRSCCASVRAESRWGGNSQGHYFCSLRKSIIFACKKKRDADARC